MLLYNVYGLFNSHDRQVIEEQGFVQLAASQRQQRFSRLTFR